MKKKEQVEIASFVLKGEASELYSNKIIKEGIIKFSIRLGFLVIVLLLSIIFRDKMSTLSKMLHTTLFPNTQIFGPLFFYIFISIAIEICLAYILFVCIYRKAYELNTAQSLRLLYKLSNISDMSVFIVSVITYIYFIIIFVITPCNVEGTSMNYTYEDNDKVLVYNFNYTPKYEDVVIFDASNPLYGFFDGFWIKRVQGIPGMTISFDSGYLVSNGEIIKPIGTTGYLSLMHSAGIEGTNPISYVIPDGRYLLIGDNRIDSLDSAFLGFIYEEDIVGKVILRVYPFNKIGYPTESNRT